MAFQGCPQNQHSVLVGTSQTVWWDLAEGDSNEPRRATSPGSKPRGGSGLRQGHTRLALILAATILVRNLTHLIRFKEQYLGDAFIGVDLGG